MAGMGGRRLRRWLSRSLDRIRRSGAFAHSPSCGGYGMVASYDGPSPGSDLAAQLLAIRCDGPAGFRVVRKALSWVAPNLRRLLGRLSSPRRSSWQPYHAAGTAWLTAVLPGL